MVETGCPATCEWGIPSLLLRQGLKRRSYGATCICVNPLLAGMKLGSVR